MRFSDNDLGLKNGYMTKGDPIAICGPPGVGKSRLVMQLAIDVLTGREFVGWATNGKGTRWLILQTENGNRRLQYELGKMLSDLTPEERLTVYDGMFIHTLETEEDALLTLSLDYNQRQIVKAIREVNCDVVVYDIFRDFRIGDLNTDKDMAETLSIIGRITRKGNPQRIPLSVQHSLTGRIGAAKATGFDRGSFGRNSKVLLGWARSQINLAPYNAEDNEAIIIASGKCNNAKEFDAFGVRLNPKTMKYCPDGSISVQEWKERVNSKKKAEARATVQTVVEEVRKSKTGIKKAQLVAAIRKESGVGSAYAYKIVNEAEMQKRIRHRKDMLERLNEELARRTHVIRIFPNEESALRLIRALAVEIHEDWIEGPRYLNMETLREQRKQLQLLEAA